MPRAPRNTRLDTRTARAALKARAAPYWTRLDPPPSSLFIGYRKLKGATPGPWVIKIYPAGGKRETFNYALADDRQQSNGVDVLDYKEACAKARSIRDQRVRKAAGLDSGPYLLADALDAYVIEREAAGRDVTGTKQRVAWLKEAFGPVALDVFARDANILRSWMASEAARPRRLRSKPGTAPVYDRVSDDPEAVRRRCSTVNRDLKPLKAACALAVRDGKVTVVGVPSWRSVKPFEGVDAARVRFFSLGESKRFLNSCSADFHRLARAGLETGARYSELGRLQVRDVNLDGGTVWVGKSKSGRARHVILTDDGRAFFETLCAGRGATETLLLQDNGEPWRKSNQQQPMLDACQRAAIEPTGFHVLRHTWASLSVMAGVPLMVVAKQLGHRDTRMVEAHYGHLAPGYISDAIRAGAPKLGGVESNIASLDKRRGQG